SNAWEIPAGAELAPTTCPKSLIPDAELTLVPEIAGPPSDPRSSVERLIFRLGPVRNARVSPLEFVPKPTTWPKELIPLGNVDVPPSVPMSSAGRLMLLLGCVRNPVVAPDGVVMDPMT